MRAVAVACALGLLAASAGAGWMLRSPDDPPGDLSALRLELAEARADRARAGAAAHEARQRARSAEHSAAVSRSERPTTLAGRADATPADAGGAPAVTPDETAGRRARVALYPLYAFDDAAPAVRDALAATDWPAVAENLAAMLPVADEIVGALARGERPSAESIGRSQELNGPLITIAMRLEAAGVPGTGANGAFTHPAFMSNAIAASLEALGMPLDSAQQAALGHVGAEFARRERQRVAARTVDAVKLRRLVEEAEQKRDYFAAARALLSDEQRNALCPPAVRGRVAADLFSEGLVWVGRAQPLTYRDEAHLAELIEARLLGDADETARGAARDIVAAWVAALPREIVDHHADALDRVGMVDAAYTTTCARHVAALTETLLRDGGVSAGAAARLRDLGGTVVLFRAPSE